MSKYFLCVLSILLILGTTQLGVLEGWDTPGVIWLLVFISSLMVSVSDMLNQEN